MQFVRVEVSEGRAYTYKWDDALEPPLEKGEAVRLPSNMVQDKEFTGTVLRTLAEPDFQGPIKSVVGRVEPREYADEDLL